MRLELGVTVWLWLVDPVIDGEGGIDALILELGDTAGD